MKDAFGHGSAPRFGKRVATQPATRNRAPGSQAVHGTLGVDASAGDPDRAPMFSAHGSTSTSVDLRSMQVPPHPAMAFARNGAAAGPSLVDQLNDRRTANVKMFGSGANLTLLKRRKK